MPGSRTGKCSPPSLAASVRLSRWDTALKNGWSGLRDALPPGSSTPLIMPTRSVIASYGRSYWIDTGRPPADCSRPTMGQCTWHGHANDIRSEVFASRPSSVYRLSKSRGLCDQARLWQVRLGALHAFQATHSLARAR